MKPSKSRDALFSRLARIKSHLSWFNVFHAQGIWTHNLNVTRLELERERESIELRLKGRTRKLIDQQPKEGTAK